MKLSEKILMLRKQRGMSQEELAEKLNVSRQAVSRWEGGSALPDATNVLQLSKLFEVSADYLLNDDYEERSAKEREQPKTDVKKIVACWISAIGLGAEFLIYLVSRFVKVPLIYIGPNGFTHWDGTYGVSYRYFIQEYDLKMLVYLFWVMALAGSVYLIVTNEKVKTHLKKHMKKCRRKSNGISDGTGH